MALLLQEFKKTKRELKNVTTDVSDVFDEINEEIDASRKQKQLQNLKVKLGSSEKTLMELESKWSMLDPQDKAIYRNKMTTYRSDYEAMRKKFYKMDDSTKSELNRQKVFHSSNNDKYGIEDGNKEMRQKLLNGTQSLYEQEGQLDNTKKMGLEANHYMKLANKQLREDRDVLIGVNDKNAQIRVDLERGNKIVTEMSMREYIYKLLIHTTAFLLLIAILAVFIHNLTNQMSSNRSFINQAQFLNQSKNNQSRLDTNQASQRSVVNQQNSTQQYTILPKQQQRHLNNSSNLDHQQISTFTEKTEFNTTLSGINGLQSSSRLQKQIQKTPSQASLINQSTIANSNRLESYQKNQNHVQYTNPQSNAEKPSWTIVDRNCQNKQQQNSQLSINSSGLGSARVRALSFGNVGGAGRQINKQNYTSNCQNNQNMPRQIQNQTQTSGIDQNRYVINNQNHAKQLSFSGNGSQVFCSNIMSEGNIKEVVKNSDVLSENISSDEAEEEVQVFDEQSSSRKQTNSLVKQNLKQIRDSYRTTERTSNASISKINTLTLINNDNDEVPLMKQIDSQQVTRNLFFMNQKHRREQYRNSVATISHKSLKESPNRLLKNTSNQTFSSMTRNTTQSRFNSQPREANLIFIQNLEQQFQDDNQNQTQQQQLDIELQDLSKTPVKNFDQMYSTLTEKLINKVLDGEIKSGGKRQSMASNFYPQTPKSVLLFGDVQQKQSPKSLTKQVTFNMQSQSLTRLNRNLNTNSQKSFNSNNQNNNFQQSLKLSNSKLSRQSSNKKYLTVNHQNVQRKYEVNLGNQNSNSKTPSKALISKRFEELYKESEMKRQRMNRIQELKEQQKRYKEMQECTFTPKISEAQKSKSPIRDIPKFNFNQTQVITQETHLQQTNQQPSIKPRRSPREFYEDMVNFQQQKEIKLNTMRKLEQMQLKSEREKRLNSLSNQRSGDDLFERLHQEELKKLKKKELSLEPKKQNSTSRTRDEIVNHLYTDFFIRDTKLKTLQNHVFTDEEQLNKAAIDLTRSNQVLADKISDTIKQAYKEMKLQNIDELSFLNLVELLNRIGYVEQFDEPTKSLLNQMWMNLIGDPNQNSEASISQRNLIIFVQAVQNIHVDSMKAHPLSKVNREPRQFGFFINGYFFIDDEFEVKKVHLHYNKLFWNRQSRIELQKKESLKIIAQSPSTLELKFQPEINPRSKQIADESLSKLENALRQGSGDLNVKIRVEDLLLSKGQVLKEKLKQKRDEVEIERQNEFSFCPQLISPRFQDSQIQGGQVLGLKSRNVFDKLYAKALTMQKKPQQLTTRDVNEEIQLEQCTFKPNLNQTHKFNQQIRNNTYQMNQAYVQNQAYQECAQPQIICQQTNYNDINQSIENIICPSNLYSNSKKDQQNFQQNSFIQYLQGDQHQSTTPNCKQQQTQNNNFYQATQQSTESSFINSKDQITPFLDHSIVQDLRQVQPTQQNQNQVTPLPQQYPQYIISQIPSSQSYSNLNVLTEKMNNNQLNNIPQNQKSLTPVLEKQQENSQSYFSQNSSKIAQNLNNNLNFTTYQGIQENLRYLNNPGTPGKYSSKPQNPLKNSYISGSRQIPQRNSNQKQSYGSSTNLNKTQQISYNQNKYSKNSNNSQLNSSSNIIGRQVVKDLSTKQAKQILKSVIQSSL
eukprot:403336108